MAGVDIGFIRQALNGLAQRQEPIANNIANMETPGYKRATVSFESVLQRQLADQQAVGRQLRLTPSRGADSERPGQMSLRWRPVGGGGAVVGRSLAGLSPQQFTGAPRNDANTVDLDQEMTDLATTQIQFAGLSAALNARLRTLRQVIESS